MSPSRSTEHSSKQAGDAHKRLQARVKDLRLQARALQSVLDNSRDVIVSYDIAKESYEFVSSSVVDLIGYTPAECIAMPRQEVMAMLHPDDQEAFKKAELEADTTGISEVEYRQRARDGRWVWVSNRMSVSRDRLGRPSRRISNIRDITERKQAEEERRQAAQERRKNAAALALERKRLFDVLETMTAMVCLMTPDHRVAFANRAFRDMYSQSDGGLCYERRCGYSKPCAFCEAFEPLKTGKPHHWQFTLPDGKTVINAHDFPFTDADGTSMVLEVSTDITERRKAEAEFSYLATFPQLSPNPITEVDPDGNLVYANPAAQRMFADLEERGRLHPYLAEWDTVMARLNSEVRVARDVQVGDTWFDQSVFRLPSSQNVRIYGRDITSRKRVESYLRDALQRIDAHFANSPLAVVEFDPEYRVIRWSDAAERLFGWTADEVVGRQINDFRWVVQEDSRIVDVASAEMFSGANQRNLTVNRNYRKDGSIVTCEWYNSALYDEQGKMVSVLSQVLDITERIKTDQIKDEFIGMVSHELKTPLTVVTGAIRVAITEALPEAEKSALLEDAAWGAETMADIVDNLLELSRWQSHRLVLLPAPVDIGAVIERVVRQSSKKSVRHQVVASVAPRLPGVNADAHRIERILENLVDNAIKYSPGGGEVKVSARSQANSLLVSVTDSGIGIAKNDMDRLFQPFGRLETPVTGSAVQGVGLGLVVCRRLVEAHRGRIWVESEPGKGSTFFFTLPL